MLETKSFVDRSSLRPEGGPCFVSIEVIASGDAAEPRRAPARTVLALDVSRSMTGQPLEHVVRSVDRLLDALDEEDEIGIVAFSENATSVVEPVRADAVGRRLVRTRVGRLATQRGTNIEAGIERAAAMVGVDRRRCGIVLLSDGEPNVGASTAAALRDVVKRHRASASLFALGYGTHHSEDILAAVGDAGGGGYEYIPDPTSCARSFARALGVQGDVVASAIELVIAPADGVELVRFIGREDTRFTRDGIRIALPDMIAGGRRIVTMELSVAPKNGFLATLVRATATWKEPRSADARSATEEPTIEIADREPAIAIAGARRVLLARAEERRLDARALADRSQFAGAAQAIRALLREIDRLPGFVAADGSLLAEAYELLLDEAMAYERKPSPEQYAVFRKATATARLTEQAPASARDRGRESQRFMGKVAGDVPRAWLVLASGGKHLLEDECVIGRTADADLMVNDPSVSRRHAEVFASAGVHWVADLGSTNPTIVNGKALGRAPHALRDGDVIRVGGTDLRYERASTP
jgi:Ca-activated chloride channel homolog